MKTLADFKKRLAPGVKLYTVHHMDSAGRDDEGNLIFRDEVKGVREVMRLTPGAFSLSTPCRHNSERTYEYWCAYPKPDQVKILSPDSIMFLETEFRKGMGDGLIPLATHTFITEYTQYSQYPDEVRAVLERHIELDSPSYDELLRMDAELRTTGYTVEFDLSGTIISIIKIK